MSAAPPPPRPRDARLSRSGMTLLEVLLAVAILGVCLVGLMQGMTAGVADVTVGGAGGMAVTIPLSIDGQKLTQIVAQIQWQQGTAAVRNYGVALA